MKEELRNSYHSFVSNVLFLLQLKTLQVVLKNLMDPSKGGLAGDAGLKYRTLKLDNPKLQARLFCTPCIRNLLVTIVEMVPKDNILVLPEPPSPQTSDVIALKLLPAISNAQQQVAKTLASSSTTTNTSANKKAKLIELNSMPSTEKLSEKQKARLLMEHKEKLEKEREKEFRKQTRAKIAADKLVRQKDENWKPTVSAAAAKTGSGLLTFRDRHGE